MPRIGEQVRLGRGVSVWQVLDVTETLITLERNHWTHHSLPVDQMHRLHPVEG